MARKEVARLGLFGISLAAFAAATGVAPALAQEAAEATTEAEIVVTGFRGSLAAAMDQKRAAVGSIDAIVAEDIADFPDLNLAESLQRVPGVSIDRDAGEGRQISVRGLDAQFTRVRINGMEVSSATGATDSSNAAGNVGSGTNRSRGFDFNVFASDLFNNLTVRKTASADIPEGSLGATVDMRTARPFDFDGFTFAVTGQMGYNDLAEQYDPRGTFLISHRGEKFGALLSAAYSERNSLEEGHSTVRWQSGAMRCPVSGVTLGGFSICTAAQDAEVDRVFTPRIPRYDILEHAQKRLGVTGALQWRPTPDTEISLEALHSKLDSTRTELFLEAPDFSAGGATGRAGIIVNRDYVVDGNTMTFGRFQAVDVRSEARFDELTTTFNQVSLSAEHEFTDRFRGNAYIGFGESEFDNPIQTTLLFDHAGAGAETYAYDYRVNENLPLITYGFDTSNPASYRLTQIRLRPQTALNSNLTSTIDLAYDLSDDWSLRGGYSYQLYRFKTTDLRRSNGTTANLEAIIPASIGSTALSSYSTLAAFSDAWDTPDGTVLSWLVPDVEKAGSLFNLYDRSVFPLGPQPSIGNNRSVREEDSGLWAMLELDTMAGGARFRGNFGVRYVETQQSSTGFAQTPALISLTVDREYTDTLPSVNLSLEATDNLIFRASFSKVMSRPNLNLITPGGSASVSGSNRTVNFGNPLLEPYRADTFDLSAEYYFANEALISFAAFFKDIGTFVQSVAETRPFTGNSFGLPDSVAVAACGSVVGCSPAADWVFTVPANTEGGDLTGIEIGYQQPFSFLPAPFDNFGLLLNYTYVDSSIVYIDSLAPGGRVERPLIGLSKEAWNATLYYQGERLSGRVSAAYRDGYLSNVPGRNGNNVEGKNETMNIDAAAAFTINDNFKLTFEGINLTDEVNDQFVDLTDRVFVYHHTGRQYFVGFRYSY